MKLRPQCGGLYTDSVVRVHVTRCLLFLLDDSTTIFKPKEQKIDYKDPEAFLCLTSFILTSEGDLTKRFAVQNNIFF